MLFEHTRSRICGCEDFVSCGTLLQCQVMQHSGAIDCDPASGIVVLDMGGSQFKNFVQTNMSSMNQCKGRLDDIGRLWTN